jgi:uncharacterized protein
MGRVVCIVAVALGFGFVQARALADPGNDLRVACWNGDLSKATELVNEGAPIEGRDSLGRTPLFLACHGDSADIVKMLLQHGAKIDDAENDGDLPIAHACDYGDLATSKMLLAAGASSQLSHVNKYGRTALMLAARGGHDALVSLLISQHIDLNFAGGDDPALFYAVAGDHYSTVQLLLDAGAQVTRPPGSGVAQKNPETIVSLAVHADDTSLITLLLDHGAQINERNKIGISALLQACVSSRDPSIIPYLLDKGADPNLADNIGQTPLIAAVDNQDIATLRLLLEKGARLETPDNEGRTPLIHAGALCARDHIEELIRQKANVNAVDNHGETALTYAGDRGDTRIVNLLKAAGATRTDVHIIAKQDAVPPLTKSQRWALAVGALYAQCNASSHTALTRGRFEGSPTSMLKDDWGIEDRASLLRTVHTLERGSSIDLIMVEQIRSSLSNPTLEAKLVRAFQLLPLDLWWGTKTNTAWNLCRAANLVRAGVQADYIKEDEAWPIFMDIARKAQSTFGSWQEMSDNFLDWREIGENERSGDFRACSRLLLNPNEPNSPWNQLPWKTDLSGN